MHPLRPAAVSGTWYPAAADVLASAVDGYLAEAGTGTRFERLTGIIAPHAGLVYSGPVAAHAYRQLEGRAPDTVVLVGPSHFVGFDGVAIYPHGAFDCPLGAAPVDEPCAARLMAASPLFCEHPSAHRREHSLEMQLPFIRRLVPGAAIVPLVIGWQTAAVAIELGRALAAALAGSNAVMVASSDLSHYQDAGTARTLDEQVVDCVERFDADGLQSLLDLNPQHACGGGAMVAVMRAAQALGARDAAVLHYADSGDVSGDKSSVVGYMAAALGAMSR